MALPDRKVSQSILKFSHLPRRDKIIRAALILALFTSTVYIFFPDKSDVVSNRQAPLSNPVDASNLKIKPAEEASLASDTVSKVGEKSADTSIEKTAKIVTCPRCRLNSLPSVKKFVYTHAKLFEPKLQVDFIFGEDPTLHLYEDGKEVSKIALAVSKSHPFVLCILTLIPIHMLSNLSLFCKRLFQPFDWKQIIQKLVAFGIKPTEQTDEIREALKTR